MRDWIALHARWSTVAVAPLLRVIAVALLVSAREAEALEIRVRYHEEVAAWEQQGGAPQLLLEQIRSAVDRAVAVWESKLADPIVIHLEVRTEDTGSALAFAYTFIGSIGYTALLKALQDDATSANDRVVLMNLPKSPPLVFLRNDGDGGVVVDNDGGENNLVVDCPRAVRKALGLLPPDDPNIDGQLLINTAFPPDLVLLAADFDRSDGVAADRVDVQSLIEHEIGHTLGFTSAANDPEQSAGVEPLRVLDLFRFANGPLETRAVRSVHHSAAGEHPYFSIDGGRTALAEFDPGSSHWRGTAVKLSDGVWIDPMPTGTMIPNVESGSSNRISSLDLLALDVIGYDLAPSPRPGLANLRIVRDSGRFSASFGPTSVVSDSLKPRIPAYRFQVSSDLRVWRDVTGNFEQADGVLASDRFEWQPEANGIQFVRLAGGIDLSGEDLSYRDLSRAYLVGADLSDAELFKTEFRECRLDRADLRGSNLRGAQFAFASLRSADLLGCDLERANFYRADLEGAMFVNARFKETVMPDGSLRSDP